MNIDDLFTPCQREPAPTIDQTLYTDVPEVDLQDLEPGTIVQFKGTHPCSNYVVEILGAKSDSERNIKIWYVGSATSCFIGPQSGCLKTKAKNLGTFILENVNLRNRTKNCILKTREEYMLPLYRWNEKGEVYPDYRDTRIETCTKIKILTEVATYHIFKKYT